MSINSKYTNSIIFDDNTYIIHPPKYIGISTCLHRNYRDSLWIYASETITEKNKEKNKEKEITEKDKEIHYLIRTDQTSNHTSYFLIKRSNINIWDCFIYVVGKDINLYELIPYESLLI